MTPRDSVTVRPGQQRNKECSQGCWPQAGQQELGEAPLVVSPVQYLQVSLCHMCSVHNGGPGLVSAD